jgi:hypothetical protein
METKTLSLMKNSYVEKISIKIERFCFMVPGRDQKHIIWERRHKI